MNYDHDFRKIVKDDNDDENSQYLLLIDKLEKIEIQLANIRWWILVLAGWIVGEFLDKLTTTIM